MNTTGICFGDRISVCCERTNNFLCSTGVSDARIFLSEQLTPGKVQLNFDTCIFSIEKPKSHVSSSSAALSVHSSLAKDSNAPEGLMFGNVVRLRHIYSGHYVSITRQRRQESKGSLHVAVEQASSENNSSLCFRVMPRYKIRQEGERVCAGDHLVLLNEHLKVHLALDLSGQEIVGSSTIESFSFFVIDGAEVRNPNLIRLQKSVLLFHKEQESFFQLSRDVESSSSDDVPVLVHPHIKDSTYNIAALDFSANALWVLEGLQGTEGGAVSVQEAYRLKHGASGRYLSASPTRREQLMLVDQPIEGDGTLWSFIPCDTSERNIQSSSTFFRVQNVSSGSWLHTQPPRNNADSLALTQSPTTIAEPGQRKVNIKAASYMGQINDVVSLDQTESRISGLLSLVERPAYVDVFCAVAAPYSAERDLHRVLGYRSLLLRLRQQLVMSSRRRGAARATDTHSLLEEVINGGVLSKAKPVLEELTKAAATSSHELDPEDNIPAAEHEERVARQNPFVAQQRVLLDQGLHQLMVDILDLILRFEDWHLHVQVVATVNQMLRSLAIIVKDNVAGCLSLSACVHLLAPFLSRLPSACEVFTEVSRVQSLHSSLVQHVVGEVIPHLGEHDAYFRMLEALCFGGGVPNAVNQEVVFSSVLESNRFPKLCLTIDGIQVTIPSAASDDITPSVPVLISHLHEDYSPTLKYCAGFWKVLGSCTVGRPYPPLAWVEIDHIPTLMSSINNPLLMKSVLSIARSAFLADVECVEEQHPQLWSWKYKTSDVKSSLHITQIQETIMKETMILLETEVGLYAESDAHCELLNELLVLWNSVILSQSFTQPLVDRLNDIIGKFIATLPKVFEHRNTTTEKAGSSNTLTPRVQQAIFHVLQLAQLLLEDHTQRTAKEIRHAIRPQLHEEVDDNMDALAASIRERASSGLASHKSWLPQLLLCAGVKQHLVATAALSCIFKILSPATLALHHIESSLVFSEGYEMLLANLLDLASSMTNERFSPSRSVIKYEATLTEIKELCIQASQDLSTALDAQNVLHFSGVHNSICQFLDAAQRASCGHLVANVAELGMYVLNFMSSGNPTVSSDMVSHLPVLTQLSTLCQSTTSYFSLLQSSFAAADEDTVVEVTKLINDIFNAEVITEASLLVVIEALKCPSKPIRENARDATVSAMNILSFENINTECKPMILDIVCECAAPETFDLLARNLSIRDVLSVMPSSKEFIASNEAKGAFEVCVRTLTLLFLREGVSMPHEDAEVIREHVLDIVVDLALSNAQLQLLPPMTFDCLQRLTKFPAFRSMFLAPLKTVASLVLNHCETSVNTKFQLSAKDNLLGFLECVEEYIRPDSLPNIAVVRRRLQRIVKHSESGGQGTSSSISGHWAKIRSELSSRLREPSEEDLQPLTELLSAGTLEAKETIRLFILHLRNTDLTSWVSVSLLLCLRFVLSQAESIGEMEMTRTQDLLNNSGATPLLSTLLEKPDFDVVRHAIKFGISLLEGGHKHCQDALLKYFQTHDEKFFFTIRTFLKLAQLELQSKSPSQDPDATAPLDSFSAMAQDLCRLLQLLCEGHHFEFQNYVRHQKDNFNTYNMCHLVMDLLHTVVQKMDPLTLKIAVQALNTLTEFCQGPCQKNQSDIVACNVVSQVNRILTMEYPEDHFHEDDVMNMKQAAIVLLLSLLEGSQDSSIPNLLLTNIDTGALHSLLEHVWKDARGLDNPRADGGASSSSKDDRTADEKEELLELGVNIFILAKILIANGDKVKADLLASILKDTTGYEYFNSSICNIEIWRDDDPSSLRLETVYFRKPEICRLREETKEAVMNEVDRSSLMSKHSDFCKCADDLIFEMEFQFQIEEAARSINKYLRIITFNLAMCRPRPVEDLLLLLSLISNLMVVSGFTDRGGPINWPASFSFFIMGIMQFLCSVYLVVVHLVLTLPRLTHRSLRKAQQPDPFLGFKTWKEKFQHVASFERVIVVAKESYTIAFTTFAVASLCGVFFSPFFYTFLLAMVTFKAPLLANIVNAITMNGRQLLLTAFLGVISTYFFSVIGFLFFNDHFERSEGGGSNCETLLQCFFFSFGQGVRGGGGIGEELKPNLWESPDFFRRELYDTLFFVIVAVIVMNIVFALIVDTFAELRDARKKIEDDMKTTCFVCGLDAATFDREGEGFGPHTKGPHNVWGYLYFLHHLRRKEVCEYTGQESYVAAKISKFNLSFFPMNCSKSLKKQAAPDAAALLAEGGDESEARGGGAGNGPSLEEMKKAMKEIVEEQVKTLRPSTNASVSPLSSSDRATHGGTRASALWAKARSQRVSLIKSNVGGGGSPPSGGGSPVTASAASAGNIGQVDDAYLTLAPCLQAVNAVRKQISSINELLDAEQSSVVKGE